MFKKFFFLLLAGAFLATPVWAAGYKNQLSSKSWAKYGVNPWRVDTDYDGFADVWEVKNKYCPTSPEKIALDSSDCQKGSFNLKKGVYNAPTAVKNVAPRGFSGFSSCTQMQEAVNSSFDSGITESGVGTGLYANYQAFLNMMDGAKPSVGTIKYSKISGAYTVELVYDDTGDINAVADSFTANIYHTIKGKKQLVRADQFAGVATSFDVQGGYVYLAIRSSLDYDNPAVKKCTAVKHIGMAGLDGILDLVSIPLASQAGPTHQAFLGYLNNAFFRGGKLYLLSERGGQSNPQTGDVYPMTTEIYQFALQKGKFALTGSNFIPGLIINPNNFIPSGKYLYVVTSDYTDSSNFNNKFYILDSEMNKIGWYDNFGGGVKISRLSFSADGKKIYARPDNKLLFIFDVKNPHVPQFVGSAVFPE